MGKRERREGCDRACAEQLSGLGVQGVRPICGETVQEEANRLQRRQGGTGWVPKQRLEALPFEGVQDAGPGERQTQQQIAKPCYPLGDVLSGLAFPRRVGPWLGLDVADKDLQDAQLPRLLPARVRLREGARGRSHTFLLLCDDT